MKRSITSAVALFIIANIPCACNGTNFKEIELDCSEPFRYALYFGAKEPPDFDIDGGQMMAIGSLEDNEGLTLCTGTLIRSKWVITAAHCDEDALLWYRSGLDEANNARFYIIRRIRHPEQDIMLLEIEKSEVSSDLSIVPIEVWNDEGTSEWLGSNGTLAGLGFNELGDYGVRLFVSESIVEVTPTTIEVDGKGESGACTGDSGGPLLYQNQNGSVKVIGILFSGSSNCLGIDLYLRTDVYSDWITSTINEASNEPCGDITREGKCFEKTAIYCEDDKLIYKTCPENFYCAFSIDADGYRCISQEDDNCGGIDHFGTCKEDIAARCVRGTLVRKDCKACRQTCDTMSDGYADCI